MPKRKQSPRAADAPDASPGRELPDAGKDAFIAALRRFHQDCGAPPFRRLVRISKDLPALYPTHGEVPCTLREISLTAISEVLAGRRKGLPAFDWVASFVLACQRYAAKCHVTSHDPGTTTLPAWAKRLAAHTAASAWLASAGELSPRQQTFITGHGPYGPVLLAQARDGDPDSLYRIALLLATDLARTDDALALLIAAAAAGNAAAIDLLDANPAELHPSRAARGAHDLARAAQARGSRDEALAFYRAAARGGIPVAVIEHAQAIFAAQGDDEAVAWLEALITKPSSGRHRATSVSAGPPSGQASPEAKEISPDNDANALLDAMIERLNALKPTGPAAADGVLSAVELINGRLRYARDGTG